MKMKIIKLECNNLHSRIVNAPPTELKKKAKIKIKNESEPDDFSAAVGES